MIDFNELIANHLKREFRKKEIGKYYPSEIGSCLRKVWYSFVNPKELSMDTIRIMEMGNMVHEFILHVLRSEKNQHIALIENEAPFKLNLHEYAISGRIDDVVLLKIEQKKYVVEVKSTKALKMVEKPSDSHAMQLNLYLHALGINDGILLYVERNTLQTKSFELKFNEELMKKTLERFTMLHTYLKEALLPPPEARLRENMGWMCKNCEYREECYQANPSSSLP